MSDQTGTAVRYKACNNVLLQGFLSFGDCQDQAEEPTGRESAILLDTNWQITLKQLVAIRTRLQMACVRA
jgi:hypothetical protein